MTLIYTLGILIYLISDLYPVLALQTAGLKDSSLELTGRTQKFTSSTALADGCTLFEE